MLLGIFTPLPPPCDGERVHSGIWGESTEDEEEEEKDTEEGQEFSALFGVLTVETAGRELV